MPHITRKTFIKSGAAAVLSAPLLRMGARADEVLVERLQEFGYDEVVVGGRLRAQFDANHAFFMALSEDSMLKPYRLRTGLPAPGDDLGGWYSDDPAYDPHGISNGYVPGGTLGQYISGLARAYAITKAPATRAKVERLVHGLAPALSEKFYRGYHTPTYTYDKIERGLLDAWRYAGVREALPLIDKATDAISPYLPEKALSRTELYLRPHANEADCWDESYTLPENFLLTYKATGNERYRKLAIRFLQDDTLFNPLAGGVNALVGKHAYSHMNALSSAFQAWLTLGSEKHFRAAKNGFDFVAAQSFVTGGWGPLERFREPGSAEIGGSLFEHHDHFETGCGTYAHFKLCRYLMCETGDSRYGDSMERVLYNAILGALPLQTNGRGFYYSDYNIYRAHKDFRSNRWNCCSGSFPQVTADYAISAFFRSSRALFVNLYVPSRVNFSLGGAKASLRIETTYPYTPQIALLVDTDRAARFAVNLRIPAWAGPHSSVTVNGSTVPSDVLPGRFLSILREWNKGDRIEIEFDMPLRLEAVDPEHPEITAPIAGPLALFALENGAPSADKPNLLAGVPVKVAKSDLMAIRQAAPGASDWTMPSSAGTIRLKPFADIGDEHYRLYHRLS
jgi:uncharacterized protein